MCMNPGGHIKPARNNNYSTKLSLEKMKFFMQNFGFENTGAISLLKPEQIFGIK